MDTNRAHVKVRFTTIDDKDVFLGLVRQKDYPASPSLQVTSQQRQHEGLDHFESRWADFPRRNDVKLLLAESEGRAVAFLALVLNQRSGLTGDVQSKILDHGGCAEAYPDLVEAALAVCRQNANKYLTTKVYPCDPKERLLFQSVGFKPELTRVVKAAQEEDLEGPCRLRLAEASDLLWIALLNSKSIFAYMYANRQDSAEQVAARNFGHYLNLSFANPEKLQGYVAEDSTGPLGYVLLQNNWNMDVSNAPGSYVYDVALQPRCWGTRVPLQLAYFGHSQVKKLGRDYVFGDISLDNPRALRWAVRMLGYQVDWERWGRPVGTWATASSA